jgi:hypothetical protein
MQPQDSAELKTLMMNNSIERMNLVEAHVSGRINFAELTRELQRLDQLLETMLTDWSANHSLVVPVLPEDLICRSMSVLQENQYN